MWHLIRTDFCDNGTEIQNTPKDQNRKVQLINLPFDKKDSEKASCVREYPECAASNFELSPRLIRRLKGKFHLLHVTLSHKMMTSTYN